MDLQYSTLNEQLFKTIPELEFAGRRLNRDWDGEEPGPHVVFGDILLPWLTLKLTEHDHERLLVVFEFLEVVASHPDIEVQNVIAHSVLEPGICSDGQIHSLAKRYMGPVLRSMCGHDPLGQ